jgi:protein-disulfide isomerase
MKMDFRWTVAAVALLAAGCNQQDDAASNQSAASSPPPATDASRDWTETVSRTPVGGFAMGNPDARVRIVEYASLTCPHCADFAANGAPKLKEYVKSGQVNWEFRPFVLNSIDVAVSALASCQGEGPFFKLAEQLYASQPEWIGKFQAIPEAEAKRIGTLPEEQQFLALAKAGGIDGFFRARGMPEGKISQCLSEKTNIDRLVSLRELGVGKDKVTGTPTFLLNGTLQEGVYGWPDLEPKLKDALG